MAATFFHLAFVNAQNLMVILLILLLLFGAGQAIKEFRKTKNDRDDDE